MIESNRLCRIMIKDMKTRISKLNIDFDFEAYWEIIYLILLAFFVGMRFLLSTMFTIYWPKYFYRTLTVIGVVLVLLHLMMAKDISKKEIAAMLVVTFVFMMSHYVSRYDFLVDLLILILGAYRVNFRNILKTYIAVWSVLLVVTIIGAMMGLAENLVYYQGESGERVRMALGICYPTDLAAYVAFLMFAYVCVRDEYITYLEIGVMAALAGAVYYVTDARTDFVVMIFMILIVLLTKKKILYNEKMLEKDAVEKMIYAVPIITCSISLWITSIFDYGNDILFKLNEGFASSRLSLGKQAIDEYGISLFGQHVYEKGYGGTTELTGTYFFMDSSYISIFIKYGALFGLLIVTLNIKLLKDGYKEKWGLFCVSIILICTQSMMEHHMIQYWYNPFIICFFCDMNNDIRMKIGKMNSKILNLNQNI